MSDQPASPQKSERLFTFSSGGWVLLIAVLLTLGAAAIVLKPVFDTGFQPAIGDGRNPDTYGFDLSNLSIPRDQLVASGKAKDATHAVPASIVETMTIREIEVRDKNEYMHFLIPSDKIIGVTLGNESRAYPVRLLNVHEVVNDVIDNIPIAVTWSPLSGSAAVFQRPDKETEFGVSGLLYNSTSIYFDRHSDPKQESLYPQLLLHAIAGPNVSKPLTLLPFELTTWKSWSTRHPDVRVFRGLRTLEKNYNDAQDPYNLYLANDDLKFPITTPLPQNLQHLAKKTPITLTTTDDGKTWKATFWPSLVPATMSATETAPATQAHELHLYSFLFAWYAQHQNDTAYSVLEQH